MPPLSISEDEICIMCEALKAALDDLLHAELTPQSLHD